MTTEQPKPAQTTQDHPYPPVVPYSPQQFNGATYPPPGPAGAYPPTFFAYPPPPEGSHGENGQTGTPPGPPYMMAYPPPPPGMVYAFPPPQGQGYVAPQTAPAPPAMLRPKRKQVKMACTNCAAACKRCDETRPCERCQKYGISDSCVDGQRKERKKGIKRGPYKRKNQTNSENAAYGGDGEWAAGNPPAATAATTTAAIHAVAHQFTPEGFYPVYYPPPGPYLAHPHDSQPGQDGPLPHTNGQPAIMPYYIHPGGYPPSFAHYAHPAMYPPQGAPPPPQPQQQPQAQSLEPADVGKKITEPVNGVEVNGSHNSTEHVGAGGAQGKKRPRTSKGSEPRVKRVKGNNARSSKVSKDDDGVAEQDGGEGDSGP